MGARRKGREAALQILFQRDASGQSAGDTQRLYWGTLAAGEEGREFADALVEGVAAEAEAIDRRITEVSANWRLERMTRVDRNILRLATYELLALDDVPRRVTINEAVELAKRFGTEASASFVNGVLDRIARDLGKD